MLRRHVLEVMLLALEGMGHAMEAVEDVGHVYRRRWMPCTLEVMK